MLLTEDSNVLDDIRNKDILLHDKNSEMDVRKIREKAEISRKSKKRQKIAYFSFSADTYFTFLM